MLTGCTIALNYYISTAKTKINRHIICYGTPQLSFGNKSYHMVPLFHDMTSNVPYNDVMTSSYGSFYHFILCTLLHMK